MSKNNAMDNSLKVKISRKNESSLCLMFIASVMLLSVALFAILPPIVSRHHFDIYKAVIEADDNEGTFHHGEIGSGLFTEIGLHTNRPIQDVTPKRTSTSIVSTSTTKKPQADEVVQTQYGSVRGIIQDGVRAFHGVPYAKPPVGQLRWSSPSAPEPWKPEEYDATRMRPACPQRCTWQSFCPRNMSEDCLYLEIYTPITQKVVTSSIPVLIYIHGGSFNSMSSTIPVFDPTNFVRRAEVIVVLMEYRLGALGFFAAGQASGNYGILDQQQAIKWVKDNIGDFGGDPDRITLAGQSAGAQSAMIHLVSDKMSPYFQHVILESPPMTLRYKTKAEAKKRGLKFARNLYCGNTNDKIDMDCLRDKSVDDVLDAQDRVSSSVAKYMDKIEPWGPVIDHKIVEEQVLDSIKAYSKVSEHKPILIGETSEEALPFVYLWLHKPTAAFLYNLGLSFIFNPMPHGLEKLYPVTHPKDTREDMSILATDYFFRCPIKWSVQKLGNAGQDVKIWSYMWDHPMDGQLLGDLSMCQGKTCHGVEIPYVFQSFSKSNIEPSAIDLELSNKIIDYYANFIKFGDPNGNSAERRQKRRRRSRRENGSRSTQNQNDLPFWPLATGSDSFTQLVFTRDGDLGELENKNDERCDMWDDYKYGLYLR